MRVVIVGMPFSGKSTLFSAITGAPLDAAHAAEERLASVKAPDARLDFLEEVFKPRKRTEATMEFVDLPGAGDAENAGLTKHLPSLRQADALLIVVRGFENAAAPAFRGRVDAAADLRLIREEMQVADFVICENRIERLEAAIKKPTKDRDKQKAELDLLHKCRAALEEGQPLSDIIQSAEDQKTVRSFGFLTQKESVVAVNVNESAASKEPPLKDPLARETIAVCASIEAEIMGVEEADRPAFMEEWGIDSLARDRIVRASFDALGMISFLTAGEQEVRAWPIPRGFTAVEAAGKIHSDLARGFIRAETVAFDDLKKTGSMRDAKAQNMVRQEPKHYVVQDGDIMTIKFNV